jgi:hypothetical protein
MSGSNPGSSGGDGGGPGSGAAGGVSGGEIGSTRFGGVSGWVAMAECLPFDASITMLASQGTDASAKLALSGECF